MWVRSTLICFNASALHYESCCRVCFAEIEKAKRKSLVSQSIRRHARIPKSVARTSRAPRTRDLWSPLLPVLPGSQLQSDRKFLQAAAVQTCTKHNPVPEPEASQGCSCKLLTCCTLLLVKSCAALQLQFGCTGGREGGHQHVRCGQVGQREAYPDSGTTLQLVLCCLGSSLYGFAVPPQLHLRVAGSVWLLRVSPGIMHIRLVLVSVSGSGRG